LSEVVVTDESIIPNLVANLEKNSQVQLILARSRSASLL
jgi:hypothetical protein